MSGRFCNLNRVCYNLTNISKRILNFHETQGSFWLKHRLHFGIKKLFAWVFFRFKNWKCFSYNLDSRSFVTFFGVWRRPIYSTYIYVRVKDGPDIPDWSQRILQKYQRNIIKHTWIRASSLWSSSCRNQSIFVRSFLGKILVLNF